jgi:hypothetical protein
VQQELLEIIGKQEPEVIERLENQLNDMKVVELENATTVLERFAVAEDRRRLLRKIIFSTSKALFPILIGVSAGAFFARPFGNWHYGLWILTAVSLPISIVSLRAQIGEHLGGTELRRLLQENTEIDHA